MYVINAASTRRISCLLIIYMYAWIGDCQYIYLKQKCMAASTFVRPVEYKDVKNATINFTHVKIHFSIGMFWQCVFKDLKIIYM